MVVADLNGTIGFYRDKLGFDVDPASSDESGWAIVRKGDTTLLFQSTTGWTTNLLPKRNMQTSGLVTYRMYVDDLVRLYEHMHSRVPIVRDLNMGPEGTPEFSIRDCNGFILTFIQTESD